MIISKKKKKIISARELKKNPKESKKKFREGLKEAEKLEKLREEEKLERFREVFATGKRSMEVLDGARKVLGDSKSKFSKRRDLEALRDAAEKVDKRVEKWHEKGIIDKKMKETLNKGTDEERILKFKKVLEKLG